ncbi:TY5A, partial [Symbiodinium sp. CCMP2592]
MQPALQAHQAQDSLISPQRRRPDEDGSASSLNQDMVLEEVRRQVHMAMQGRDQEVRALKQRNEELERALVEANSVMRVYGSGGGSRPATAEPGGQRQDPPGAQAGPQASSGDPGRFRGRSREPRGYPSGTDGGELRDDGLKGPPGPWSGAAQTTGPRVVPQEARPGGEHGQAAGSQGDGAVEPLHLLVEGMRQLQQAYIGRGEARDTELKGSSIQLPEMPELTADSAVLFADWVYEVEQAVGGLSDKASLWFSLCLKAAREAYDLYQVSDPLTRLSLEPVRTEELCEERWSRLERRVLTLMLATLRKQAKDDAVTHRINTVPGLLYRLHILYAPGRAAERASILRQLEGQLGTTSIVDTVASLRKWRRQLKRAEEMRVSIPDSSLLLRGVETLASKAVEAHSDIKFRLALSKSQLQLQYRPTLDGVLKYYDHILAELQQATPARTSTTTTSAGADATKLKGMNANGVGAGTGETSSPTRRGGAGNQQPGNGGKVPCRFFASDAGCTKGQACKFDHTFASKEAKKMKCWCCGSVQHMQKDCPVKAGASSPTRGGAASRTPNAAPSTTASTTQASTATPMLNQAAVQHQQAILESLSSATTMMPTMTTAAPSTGPASGTTTGGTATLEGPHSYDKAQEITALLQQANAMLNQLTKLQALQVSTDTSLRGLASQMADLGFNEEERLALLDSGASHPYRERQLHEPLPQVPVRVELAGGRTITLQQNQAGTLMPTTKDVEADDSATILPMGALVQQLGCDLTWTKRGGLKIVHPQFGTLKTIVKGNCPLLGETQALSLINQLEQRKLQELRESTAETFLGTIALTEVKDWDELFMMYTQTGSRTSMLQALQSPGSPLSSMGGELRAMLSIEVDLSESAGKEYLKSLPMRRSQRKSLLLKRWAVKLYEREGEDSEDFKVLETDKVVYVNVNIHRSKGFSMRGDSPMYRALMWAACRGQLEGLVGSPPSNYCAELCARQLLLWMVAKEGARLHRQVSPYILMTMDPESGWWKTPMWQGFQREYQIPVSQASPAGSSESYCTATNLELSGDDEGWGPGVDATNRVAGWSVGFHRMVVKGILAWRKRPEPLMLLSAAVGSGAMSAEELRKWRRHVANGHLPYNRHCRTCVETAATGRSHRRVIAPSCYTLSLDLAGPFRVKGESGDAKGYRYALIGNYTMPSTFGFKDYKIPDELPPEEPPGGHDDGVPAEPEGGVGHISLDEEDDLFKEARDELPENTRENQKEMDAANDEYQKLFKEIKDTLTYQNLHFMLPLKTRVASEVEAAIRLLYLQLRAEGLPVQRVHSDRARELRGQGIRRSCWPLAMGHAAWAQRECALGRSGNVVPFGAAVSIKAKVFGQGGKFDLNNKWDSGVFVGPATELRGGYVVRDVNGRYLTTMHMKTNVVDVDELVGPATAEAVLPVPVKRVMKPLTVLEQQIEELAAEYDVDERYDEQAVLDVYTLLEDACDYDYSVLYKGGEGADGEVACGLKDLLVINGGKKWHETQPFQGDRVVMMTYTPRTNNLSEEDRRELWEMGFDLPEDQEPQPREENVKLKKQEYILDEDGALETFVKDEVFEEEAGVMEQSLLKVNELQQQMVEEMVDRSSLLQDLVEEEEERLQDLHQTQHSCVESTKQVHGEIMEMLEALTDRIRQQQRVRDEMLVLKDYEQLLAELDGDLQVTHTVPNVWKHLDSYDWFRAREYLQSSLRAKREVATSENTEWFSAAAEAQGSLYAGGISAETLRALLSSTSGFGWRGATTDITTAFLQALWPEGMPMYAVVPPRLLCDLDYADDSEAWLVLRPLYGLRESPAIWSSHRNDRLRTLKIPYNGGFVTLRQSKSDSELWFAINDSGEEEGRGTLVGLLVTYVDDLFYIGPQRLVLAMHGWVKAEWPCSDLQWASDPGGVRYLGMEIFQRESGEYEVAQSGYIMDLLRAHDLLQAPQTLLPCPKEWVTDDVDQEPEDFSEADLRYGQRLIGEQLWLAMRSRPDIHHVVSYMSTWVSKHPRRVSKIALRVLSYLHKTDSPVAWRCGRQSFTMLSIMESELYQATEAAVLIENVGALLDELAECRIHRLLRVDNASAVSMLGGGPGSWRTRHLKVRSAYLLERIQEKLLDVEHIEGIFQRADLSTKMHSKMRLWALLKMWRFEGLPAEAETALLLQMLTALCMTKALQSIPGAKAAAATDAMATVTVAGMDELLLFTVIACIVAVIVWELLKRVGSFLWRLCCKPKPGRRAKKLRDMARAAAEAEVDRVFTGPAQHVGETSSSSSSSLPSFAPSRTIKTADTRTVGTQTLDWERTRGPFPVEATPPRGLVAPIQDDNQYFNFDGPFYRTEHGDTIHTRSDCTGFRLATSR